jgi:hypothetical protein
MHSAVPCEKKASPSPSPYTHGPPGTAQSLHHSIAGTRTSPLEQAERLQVGDPGLVSFPSSVPRVRASVGVKAAQAQ